MSDAILIYCNVPDEAVAEKVAKTLIERELAACINLFPKIRSIYRWQGKVEEATEHTLVIKTLAKNYATIESIIVELHPYEVPEVIAIPIVQGLPAYLTWLAKESAGK